MKILRLSDVEAPLCFDCGDCDLNEFLLKDAQLYEDEFLAHTYVIVNENEIVAYFSVLADKVSRSLVPKNVWRKLGKKIPHEKHFNSYPALKIARLAVNKRYRGQEIGTNIMKEFDTSVTYIPSYGGYSGMEKMITYCVISRLEIGKLKDNVKSIDPNAFISIENVHEVEGKRINKKK